jgi:hypothetical protein
MSTLKRCACALPSSWCQLVSNRGHPIGRGWPDGGGGGGVVEFSRKSVYRVDKVCRKTVGRLQRRGPKSVKRLQKGG